MRTFKNIVPLIIFVLHFARHAVLCAPFRDLDFESAMPPFVPTSEDFWHRPWITNTLPGWMGFTGTNREQFTAYNECFLDMAGISLWGPGTNYGTVIEGNYTAFLQAGLGRGPGIPEVDTSLSQVGDVPGDAQWLRLKANPLAGAGHPKPFGVSLGSQDLTLVAIGSGANYTLYQADVSGFRGQTAELRITAFNYPPLGYSGRTFLWFDSIAFVVPEPRAGALFLAGLAVLGLALRWQTRRRQLRP